MFFLYDDCISALDGWRMGRDMSCCYSLYLSRISLTGHINIVEGH
jgi:hypothetical protein